MKEQIHIFPNARMAQIAAVAGGNTFIDWSNGSIKFGTKQNVLEIPETIALAFCIPNLWVRLTNQYLGPFHQSCISGTITASKNQPRIQITRK